MYDNTKKVVAFVKELANALEDKKLSIGEIIGLLPETRAFFDAIKNHDELKKELMVVLYDENISYEDLIKELDLQIKPETMQHIAMGVDSLLAAIETLKK